MPETIDTVRLNETPEGIDLGLRVAGPVSRALAQTLDILIRFGLYLIMTPLAGLADAGIGLMLIAFFGIEWFYPVFFEVTRGATPGKAAMGLAVIHDDGTPVGLPASVIRNLLRTVDFLPVGYFIGLISCLVDRDFRRLGDLAAGTLVVRSERRSRPREIPIAEPRRPPLGLQLSTQQAILSYAERSQRLSEPRRVEVAEILTARMGVRGSAAVDWVMGWANWLARGVSQG